VPQLFEHARYLAHLLVEGKAAADGYFHRVPFYNYVRTFYIKNA
jgi:hypothetical protein